ncbi:hypothetical protein AN958_00265 [Leucoagaricus sp. SymC.cos]|nr:hypothetical protein AN958_00265 [Leucoagaricus sp. SymC.cos]
MFLDGLDECQGQREQILHFGLIAYFTKAFPDAPLLWLVASCPEAHITAFLARRRSTMCFEKEEVSDSVEACQDVEHFLRKEFERIRTTNPVMALFPQWPPEHQVLKPISAAVGLSAYATIIVRFIGIECVGDPGSCLQVIVDLIDHNLLSLSCANTPHDSHPTAHLDPRYRCIISRITLVDRRHAEDILVFVIYPSAPPMLVSAMCDWISIALGVMYGAVCQLHSVLDVPLLQDAHKKRIFLYHKSFSDFLCDSRRLGLS